MPTTAYSSYYSRELDVDQLGSLLNGNPLMQTQTAVIDFSPWADWIRNDVCCSSCGKTGAQIVRPSMARGGHAVLRQSHFRFVNQNGGDAHHPFCEFYGRDDGTVRQTDSLLNFGSDKSAETRAVRLLVCKGIEARLFDQSNIRAMRQWFFDLKSESRFTVDTTPEALSWARSLQGHSSYRGRTFHPAQAEMPAFDWVSAAKSQFTEENLELIELAKRGGYYQGPEWRRAGSLAAKHFGQEVFNVAALQRYYEDTLSLSIFVAKNSGIKFGKPNPDYYRLRGAPIPLLALCALMLFTSEWDMNVAIGRFASLLTAPEPNDKSLGNVIGLNPFHDYPAWRLVVLTAEITAKSLKGFDYQAQLNAIDLDLRRQHAAWKTGSRD